ncbi:MAG TPA: LacI family DNA-binding transcriptional regulator [Phycisphaerae bacterium]|nr:LacI family DNA-binding transcriptional regulator [Phycisphaerae bacterium]HRY70553.1 LacI family DNA-binding transcriptional regulator [Phycisphaerae bacterium]HSA28001.1 LacI family DNA-binding transcriptional regulator [Phycisphaerae bacterium]
MSIADVARSAGVSQATVSRVINHVPGVSAKNIHLVQQAMEHLGYTPPPPERRPGRRSPPRNRIGVLGAIVLDGLYVHTPGVLAAHLRGMEREAADHDCALAFADVSDATRLPTILEGRQLVGGILLGSHARSGVLAAIQHMPWVWLSSHSGPSGDSVLAGNLEIAEMATRYLVDRGHRHLAFLSVMSSYPAYPARAEAFRTAASRVGATADVLLDQPQSDGGADMNLTLPILRERVAGLVARFVNLAPRPTGLFLPNDMMTAMVYPALMMCGLRPGEDVEIISCNNEEAYLVGLHPRPATIDIGAELMGRRSVEQLIRKIRHPGETRQVHIAVSPVLIEPERH